MKSLNINWAKGGLLHQAELIRQQANAELDEVKKSQFAQFYTPEPVCLYMASLFEKIEGVVTILDPGCGSGVLTAAFVERAMLEGNVSSISSVGFDIDEVAEPYFEEVNKLCKDNAGQRGINYSWKFINEDYIVSASETDLIKKGGGFTHILMNPPYKKIPSNGKHRKALRALGIETVNLYSGFVATSILMLKQGGELVAIIPRSFCNGPYYKAFRELMLDQCALKHVHLFDSRKTAFSGDNVLQENIIIHLIKGAPQGQVKITSSPMADFHWDKKSQSITATDKTLRIVDFDAIVKRCDPEKIIHIAANDRDQLVIDRLSCFVTPLNDLGINVSTGAVVGFRNREHLRSKLVEGSVPLIYPTHTNHSILWPKENAKANAIVVNNKTSSCLWKNKNSYVLVRRFSSKEEKRRIVASIYSGDLPGEQIGFDNKLNVYHFNKSGFMPELALGLFIYLNSTLLDKYYRLFGGHTQINATDLRSIHYPSIESLERMATKVGNLHEINQQRIDEILNEEIITMSGDNKDPLQSEEKISQALKILAALGMPKTQQNERSALTLLALANLAPEGDWNEIERPMIGVTPIMDWCKDTYGKTYAPNTRETFRRRTLHQFVNGGLCLYNPDKPDRAVNSPKACYQLTPEVFELLTTFGTEKWQDSLTNWLENRQTLVQQYAMQREMHMIPLTLDDGTEIKLSPGEHSQLIHDIVVEFGPRFVPGSQVIYIGDTGAKEAFFREDALAKFGVTVDRKGKLPDVVLYWPEKDWLILIESVTSHGPVDGKRHTELSNLFANAKPGLVYVTAFPSRQLMARFLTDISWETEVWTCDAPTHMIHFNGVRFLGPYEQNK
jgi:adenine-specific DNA-methyltransferase